MPIVVPLVGLDLLVVVLWCIATALAIALVMDKLSSILNGVPWVGGKLSSAVKSMAQAITNAAGTLEHGIDGIIGGAWHALARYIDKMFEQFVAHSSVLLHLAKLVGHLAYSGSGLRALVHAASRVAHAALHLAHTLEREYHGIEHRVKELEHEVAAGIGADVLPRIKSLDRELHKVEHKVIPAIEGEVAAVENDVTALRRWITDNIPIPGTEAFVGAIALALGLLGLGGLRCNTLLNSLKGRGCGLWQGLEDLLGLLFDAIVFTDLCGLLPEVEHLFAELEAPIVDLVASAADAACAHPPAGWSELAAPALSLPQVYYTGPSIGG